MSKGKMKMFTCPGCGWTVKTPFGEDDIMEHSMMRVRDSQGRVKTFSWGEKKQRFKPIYLRYT
jgi:hypothetical protein